LEMETIRAQASWYFIGIQCCQPSKQQTSSTFAKTFRAPSTFQQDHPSNTQFRKSPSLRYVTVMRSLYSFMIQITVCTFNRLLTYTASIKLSSFGPMVIVQIFSYNHHHMPVQKGIAFFPKTPAPHGRK